MEKLDGKNNNSYLIKFINILFGKSALDETIKEFNQFLELSKKQNNINSYKFHVLFRRVYGDFDSLLDYIDKFYNCISIENKNIINFNRKSNDMSAIFNEINNIRNSLLHEGIPEIKTETINKKRVHINHCCANASSQFPFEETITIEIVFRDTETKEYEVFSLISRHHDNIKQLLKKIIDDLNKSVEKII